MNVDEIQFPIDSVVVAPEISHQQPTRAFDLKLYLLLLAAALLGTLAILPFSYTLMKQMDLPLPMIVLPIAMAVTVLIELLLSAAMIGLGLGLGPRLDMAWMFEPESTTSQPSTARRLWARFAQPLLIGMGLGAILVVVLHYVEISGANPNQAISMPDAWDGLLASIGAGIREEIWLRLGILTFFAWIGVKLFRPGTDQKEKVSTPIFWIANLLAALSFAAIHIPQAQMLMGLNVQLLIFIFVGNGVPGIVFGWLYWRRGLVAAMIAHFGLDLVLKVLMPLFS
jgi:hypothetical protein